MTSFVSDPRTLTKEKLKSELAKHSVPLPHKDSRKDVYVELYREHLSPRSESGKKFAHGMHGEQLTSFSSDEEEGFGDSPRRKRKPGSIGRSNMVVIPNSDITDVTTLSDTELFTTLKKMGATVGPIQDTTRAVYQRKLQYLLANGGADKNVIRQEEEEEEEEDDDYSDQEEDTQILNEKDAATELDSSYVRRRPAPSQVTSQRTVKVTNVVNNQGSKTEKVETEKVTRKGTDGKLETNEKVTTTSTVDGKMVTNTSVSTKKKGMALWIQVCIFAAVALVIFIIITTMEPSPSNPVSGTSH
ncbi:lamina-associated polypeptide 2, isoforms beta/delta/epsilon/gamma-like isoform X2 [Lineus longissimus]|uniref:lamina-associated polypeptide 2, isoforms beta/delta/epsilon/gamma-like isoform X2 n=1 Tax=Lineus longissimus TaxID=88925 RepID=UPI00315C6FF1